MERPDWCEYLGRFHQAKAGITERVLRRATGDDADDAYGWLTAAVPAGGGPILDLACGNSPLWARLPGRGYVGVDSSAAELAGGRDRGAGGRLIRAWADALPLADACVTTVVCSMGLQVLTPLPAVVAEVARVLAPGGWFILTVPDRGPVRASDVPVVAALLAVLGRKLAYPNDAVLGGLGHLLGGAGLEVRADERRRFEYPLRKRGDADLFLASLYLPGLSPWRYRAAGLLLRGYARVRVRLPLPVRRVVAVRT